MGQVVTIGLDLAKSVFQVHGVGGSLRDSCATFTAMQRRSRRFGPP